MSLAYLVMPQHLIFLDASWLSSALRKRARMSPGFVVLLLASERLSSIAGGGDISNSVFAVAARTGMASIDAGLVFSDVGGVAGMF